VQTSLEPSTLQDKAREFVERDLVRNAILGVIIFNAITLGMSTSPKIMDQIGGFLNTVDNIVLAIFVAELSLKFFAYRMAFFKNAWNIFDLLVVGVGLLPDKSGLSALRGLRVIRALRLLSVVPQMRTVVQALLDALPGMGAVIIMLSIVYYVFAVMATLMYGPVFDEWFVPDHDAGKLVDGHCAPGDGGIPTRLGVLCPVHHHHRLFGAEPVHRPSGQHHANGSGRRFRRGI